MKTAMIGIIQVQIDSRNTRWLVAHFLERVVQKVSPSREWSTKFARWVREATGRRRSAPTARPSTRIVPASAIATARAEMRRPLRTSTVRPNTGTRLRMPPRSEPSHGAPSATTTIPRNKVTASSASLRRGARSTCRIAVIKRARREDRVGRVAEAVEAGRGVRRVAEHAGRLEPSTGRHVGEQEEHRGAGDDAEGRERMATGAAGREAMSPASSHTSRWVTPPSVISHGHIRTT